VGVVVVVRPGRRIVVPSDEDLTSTGRGNAGEVVREVGRRAARWLVAGSPLRVVAVVIREPRSRGSAATVVGVCGDAAADDRHRSGPGARTGRSGSPQRSRKDRMWTTRW